MLKPKKPCIACMNLVAVVFPFLPTHIKLEEVARGWHSFDEWAAYQVWWLRL